MATDETTERVRKMNQQLTPDHILELGLGFWGSKALLSAVEMGVCTKRSSARAMRMKPTTPAHSHRDTSTRTPFLGPCARSRLPGWVTSLARRALGGNDDAPRGVLPSITTTSHDVLLGLR